MVDDVSWKLPVVERKIIAGFRGGGGRTRVPGVPVYFAIPCSYRVVQENLALLS
jgi:hypothetical protein